jgi:Uncharacterized protein family UPF0004
MPGFHVEHFGCRSARADGEAIIDLVRPAGHLIQQAGKADVVIVNTCSVTAEADRALAAEKTRTHRQRFIGRELNAITLHTQPALERNGRTTALTDNFFRVEIEGKIAANCQVWLMIIGVNAEGTLEATTKTASAPQYGAAEMSV